MQEYRYKAFISYRHMSPDQDIAKKLHRSKLYDCCYLCAKKGSNMIY